MKKKKVCRICGGTHFKPVLDMGKNPLVNSLIEKVDLGTTEPVYPLLVEQCEKCKLVQIVNPIDSHQIYKGQDYLYYSSDMPGLASYFGEFVNDVINRFVQQGDLIVEIGSNDGIFLNLFSHRYNLLGVDPSTNVVVRALQRNIPTISDFFTARLAKTIKQEYGSAKFIAGSNCIAHINNLRDVVAGVQILLADKGVFAVECNYWGGMVKNKNYSLIYHDHFSYFSLQNWVDFLPDFGMEVFDAIVTPAQGGSLRLFAGKIGEHNKTDRFKSLLQEELDTKLNTYETAKRYGIEVKQEAERLHKMIADLVDEGKVIAGYGAAAKGFSVLKLANLNENHIAYFVDDSPAKQGKFTPVSHIPVISRKDAEELLPDFFFITAPNYENVIVEKEKKFRENGGKFITVDCRIV